MMGGTYVVINNGMIVAHWAINADVHYDISYLLCGFISYPHCIIRVYIQYIEPLYIFTHGRPPIVAHNIAPKLTAVGRQPLFAIVGWAL